MKHVNMIKGPDDEVLDQIRVEMTPERKERMSALAGDICSMIENRTDSPAEGVATLQLALEAFSDRYFGKHYVGTLIVGDRQVQESACPACGASVNRVSNAAGEEPDPGSVSICSQCGAVSVFDDDMRLVEPPTEVMRELEADPVVVAMAASIKAAVERRKQQPKEG